MYSWLLVFTALALLFASSFSSALAQGGRWVIDRQRSSVVFSVKHLMVASVSGKFSSFGGTVDYDGADLSRAKIDAVIDSKSIDTGNKMRDDHLRADDVLSVAKYPKIAFVSRKITPLKGGRFSIIGDLSMHGKKQEVVLSAAPLKMGGAKGGGKQRIIAHATAVVPRKDFDVYVDRAIDKGGAVVGEKVKVDLNIELVEEAGEPGGK